MTETQYAYLLTLPLALHIPSLHSVIVHAGLVAYDIDKSPNAASQPLIVADRSAFDAEGAQGWRPVGGDSPAQDEEQQEQGAETDWSQYADDDSDAPDEQQQQRPSVPEAHGHGRPADMGLGRPTGAGNGNGNADGHGSTDAHGHGHSSEMDTSIFDDDDADAPSRRSSSEKATTGMGERRSRPRPKPQPREDDIRLSTELSILTALPQNVAPYTLTDMRSLYTHGKKRGKITKSSKKGQPWAEVWNGQMGRCRGQGAWSWHGEGEELQDVGKRQAEEADAGDAEAESRKLRCSPFTVIYGHAGTCATTSPCK